jgi:prepilin-type N-terminal cleavage/methylation domain-containing protein
VPKPATVRGFSLLELLVVVALIAVLAGAVVPAFEGMHAEARVRAVARDLTLLLRLAASQAVTTGSAHRVRVDAAGERALLECRDEATPGSTAFAPVTGIPGTSRALPAGIDLEFAPAAGPPRRWRGARHTGGGEPAAATVCFYPDGTADARRLVLRDRRGFGFAFEIRSTTGRVRVEELSAAVQKFSCTCRPGTRIGGRPFGDRQDRRCRRCSSSTIDSVRSPPRRALASTILAIQAHKNFRKPALRGEHRDGA